MTVKKESVKSTKNKQDDKKTKADSEKDSSLYTLLELVDKTNLSRFTLLTILSEKGYLDKFYMEEEKLYNHEFIEPSMSLDEFKKNIYGEIIDK